MIALASAPPAVRPRVAIYRDVLLPASETFIRAQAEALETFEPVYVGSRTIGGLALPRRRVLAVSDGTVRGRLRELLHKGLGTAPALVHRLRSAALVHAHFGPDAMVARPLARRLGVPLVVTCHGYDATMHDRALARVSFPARRYVRGRHRLWRDAALVLAVSDFIRERVIAQGCPPERVRTHYIGIDLEFFTPSFEATGPGAPSRDAMRRPLVLFVGRLVEKKGCRYLLQAMARVQAAVPDAELVVIGHGPLRRPLETFAAAEVRRCRFLGPQPPEVVRAWLAQARVFSVPSVTAESGDAEGFGIAFAEAQAMGVPVVSFASGGIPEAVADGETGFLVPERRWADLAERLALLLCDDQRWRLMSAAARRRVARLFDLRRQTRELEALYREVLASQARGAGGARSVASAAVRER